MSPLLLLSSPRDVVGKRGPPGTTLFDILKGNPKWKDFLRNPAVNAKYREFHRKLQEMSPRDRAVDPFHQAMSSRLSLYVGYFTTPS